VPARSRQLPDGEPGENHPEAGDRPTKKNTTTIAAVRLTQYFQIREQSWSARV
jgi:hypothetical protein